MIDFEIRKIGEYKEVIVGLPDFAVSLGLLDKEELHELYLKLYDTIEKIKENDNI